MVAMWSGQAVVSMWLGYVIGNGLGGDLLGNTTKNSKNATKNLVPIFYFH